MLLLAPSYEDATLGHQFCSFCQKKNKSFHSLTATEGKKKYRLFHPGLAASEESESQL